MSSIEGLPLGEDDSIAVNNEKILKRFYQRFHHSWER